MNEIETACGSFLDAFGERTSLVRSYYGDDPNVKPNENCVWYDGGYYFLAGWFESDESFRNRYKLYIKGMIP